MASQSTNGKPPVFKKAKRAAAVAKIAADRESVAIEFLKGSGAEGYLRFTRDELGRFMTFLALVRSQIPATMNRPLEKERLDPIQDPRWYVYAMKNKTGEVLIIEHPGFGPMKFYFPKDEFDKLFSYFKTHRAYIHQVKKNEQA